MSTATSALTSNVTTTEALSTNGVVTDWRASLPEDLRGEKSLEKYAGIPDLAKAYVEASKMMGNALRIPKDDAPQEERDKFYARLGRPETPDKYELEMPKLPEGREHDKELEAQFRTWAHGTGLTQKQASSLMKQFDDFQIARMEKFHADMEAGLEPLKKEWGAKYEDNLGAARRAVKELGGDELTKLLNDTGMGNHPLMIKMFAKMQSRTSESQYVVGDEGASNDGLEALKAKKSELMKSPAYLSKIDDEDHQRAVNEVFRLNMQIHGE